MFPHTPERRAHYTRGRWFVPLDFGLPGYATPTTTTAAARPMGRKSNGMRRQAKRRLETLLSPAAASVIVARCRVTPLGSVALAVRFRIGGIHEPRSSANFEAGRAGDAAC